MVLGHFLLLALHEGLILKQSHLNFTGRLLRSLLFVERLLRRMIESLLGSAFQELFDLGWLLLMVVIRVASLLLLRFVLNGRFVGVRGKQLNGLRFKIVVLFPMLEEKHLRNVSPFLDFHLLDLENLLTLRDPLGRPSFQGLGRTLEHFFE